jgi:hypothetical protein
MSNILGAFQNFRLKEPGSGFPKFGSFAAGVYQKYPSFAPKAYLKHTSFALRAYLQYTYGMGTV